MKRDEWVGNLLRQEGPWGGRGERFIVIVIIITIIIIIITIIVIVIITTIIIIIIIIITRPIIRWIVGMVQFNG